MRKLLLVAVLCCATPAFAGTKDGLPNAGIPGFVPPFGFCVAVHGIKVTGCSPEPRIDLRDAQWFRDVTRSVIVGNANEDPSAQYTVPERIDFPELGDAWDPKAPAYCVCSADSQGVEYGGGSLEKPTNSGKGGCTYWMVCYIKGVPGPK